MRRREMVCEARKVSNIDGMQRRSPRLSNRGTSPYLRPLFQRNGEQSYFPMGA